MEMLPVDATTAHEIEIEIGTDATGWTSERRVRFLSLLAEKGNVRACAAACGLSAQSAYKLRRRDPLFARAWLAALLLARDHSEQVLADRALEGVEEPIYYKGELVGTRRRYDNRLLLAHMARLDALTQHAAFVDPGRLEDPSSSATDADRFDELLALVGGEALSDGMRRDDDHLPARRETYVRHATTKAAVQRAAGEWDGWFTRACAVVDRWDAAPAPSFRARTVSTVSTAGLTAEAAGCPPWAPADAISP